MPDDESAPRPLARLVGEAAGRIERLDPRAAFAASQSGAVIIDIRSQESRDRDGVVPGSLHIPRTVLEWRVALESEWRSSYVGGVDEQLILMCDHGYSSVLAADTLVALGFHRAGDVIGGFEAWKADGLPTAPPRPRISELGALPGTGPPE